MPGATKERTRKRLRIEDDKITLQSIKQQLKPRNKGHSSLSKRNVNKRSHEGNKNVRLKRKIVNKAIVHKNKASRKKPSSSGVKGKTSTVCTKDNGKTDDRDVKRRRRRTKKKNNVELDEPSRLQRRTRYLLVKIKLEQNLIDAYSAEGWKGQSREKIKPEMELQRAKKQILKCKLGIREAIHRLDFLSSEGHINDSAVSPDGSVHHEHIICAECKLREALPDNDIILCDGTCNCAFHQNCIDPPLSTDNIPQGDEGWFCKFCKMKMEILEATNAHIGTHFPLDSNWQDVFKEEAALPDGGNSMLCQEEEWPSDDSEDDDYDPDRIVMSQSESDSSDSSSSFMGSLEDEAGIFDERSFRSFDNSLDLVGVDSDEINDGEVLCRPRQRAAVDYIQLYDEMFGKNATENEEISDDEEWGPRKRKRKVKETDAASTLMTLVENEENNSEKTPSQLKEKQLINKIKRPLIRLPHNAVEKLKLVFAENELPARTLRLSLSKQLGLEFEKVNKWFKNARYLALKARKQGERTQENGGPSIQKESISETAKVDHPDRIPSRKNKESENPMSINTFVRRKNAHLPTDSFKMKQRRKPLLPTPDSNQRTVDLGDDVSLKHLRDKAKEAKKKSNCESIDSLLQAEIEMKRLCEIKSRVEKLQQVLIQLPRRRFGQSTANNSSDPSVIFVPVAELREKSKFEKYESFSVI